MRSLRSTTLALAALVGLVALPLSACSSSTSTADTTTTTSSKTATTGVYGLTAAYDPGPSAQSGSTDVYHCSLIDPHIASDSYVTSSQFLPGARSEVHHAIYFLVTPDQASRARELDQGGQGWTCFGAPLNPTGSFDNTAWLGGWSPGHGVSPTPRGTGISIPAGSLIVMQIHYNLLAGSEPDKSRVRLTTVPAAGSHLKEMMIAKYVAPPDLPCPTGVTGPLCDRSASIADLVARTGPQAESFLNLIEGACRGQHDAQNPEIKGNLVTTTCTWPVRQTMHILGATPHMHLLGQSETISLTSGETTTLLAKVDHYNFDNQISYATHPAVVAHPGDSVTVTCTYDPTLRARNPQTRKLAPRFITWGDGSSDEMCLGSVGFTTR